MKRILSAVLVLCLVFCALTVNAATIPDTVDNQKKAGELLKEINIIKGTAQGLEEGNPLNREQAIVILLRMLGLEKEAEAFAPYGQFTDVPKSHWACKYVDFAYKKGLTNGIGNNQFGVGQLVNKKIMATYMLRALNHSADWASEDIMGKARQNGITSDAGEGLENITRGQAFIYMTNTLTQPKKDGTGMLLESLDLFGFYDKLSKIEFQAAQDGSSTGLNTGSNAGLQGDSQSGSQANSNAGTQAGTQGDSQTGLHSGGASATPRSFVSIQLPPSLKPVAAKTYLYDELEVEFNTLISFPNKSNFEFTVEGKRMEDAHYNISPGGKSIRFRFSNQNLHGKTIVCKIMDLKASDGKSSISDATITAEFIDFTPIKFVKAEVLDKKSFRGIMSVNVMPPDGHMKGTEGHEVTSDGRLMQENVDYQLGWGGKEFKVVFKNEQSYPQREASLKVWGYMTAPYHKFMDDADEIHLDFSAFEKKEIPLPEVKEPEPAVIVVEPPKFDIVEVWKEVDVVEQPKNDPQPRPADPPKRYADAKEDDKIKAKPIVVINQYYDEYMIFLSTDGKVGSVEGLKLVDKNQKEIPVTYEAYEDSYEGEQYYGFKVIPQDSKKSRDFGGYELFVEKLYESTNQVYTGPFSLKIIQIIN